MQKRAEEKVKRIHEEIKSDNTLEKIKKYVPLYTEHAERTKMRRTKANFYSKIQLILNAKIIEEPDIEQSNKILSLPPIEDKNKANLDQANEEENLEACREEVTVMEEDSEINGKLRIGNEHISSHFFHSMHWMT